MIIKIEEMILQAREQQVKISFDRINYFFGPISSGKSTIARLIMYCFGSEFAFTPALQKEFVSLQLKLKIGKYNTIIERDRGNNIVVHYNDETNNPKSLIVSASANATESLIPEEHVFNISDLIFYLGGVEPPKVLQSKLKEDTKRIRLGIKDLMWYCYLSQADMDSSFFYLVKGEDPFRQLKSRDAIRYVLGYYQEEVSKLEEEIVNTREEKTSTKQSAEQIRKILEENKIENTEKMMMDKGKYEKELIIVNKEISKIHNKIKRENEDLIQKILEERNITRDSIFELENTIKTIDKQIDKQTKLKFEFLTANIKHDKNFSASKIFREIPWKKCPECGNLIDIVKNSHTCPLCKKEKHLESDFALTTELVNRAKELDISLNNLKEEKKKLAHKIYEKENRLNEINNQINSLTEDDDSQFLTNAKNLLTQKGILEGHIALIEKLLPLPKTADDLENQSFSLESKLAELQDKYKKAKTSAEKDKENIDLLKAFFLENLIKAKFPKMNENYEVILNTLDFIPYVKPIEGGDVSIEQFSNLGSGGKQTLFKTCFALALHRVSMRSHRLLPSFLIIDSPMKNIETTQDQEIFDGFHDLIYELASNELKELQIILIGSEYKAPKAEYRLNPMLKEMTRDIRSTSPPLIPYYDEQ